MAETLTSKQRLTAKVETMQRARLAAQADAAAARDRWREKLRDSDGTLTRDVQSLQDHSSYLASKLSYLQDATLGLINIDQNNIIKIMSVAAMVFMPPTLFASIWGMNFHHMPELDQWWAYPISLVVMVISAVTPYLWFKRKGWL